MREYVFALTHEPGCNAVADALAAHPEASIRSVSCHATAESLWRVDHVSGDEDAVDAIEAAYTTTDECADCLTTGDCGAVPEIEVIDRGADSLVVYTRWERTDVCASVPHLALEHLGDGVLFETEREGRRYTWRLVVPGSAGLHRFTEAVEDEVCEHVGLEMVRLTELDAERADSGVDSDADSLPDEQREALEAAVEYGYYEEPRAVDLDDLADELEVPRSTLSYRLRRAEAHLARSFAREGGPLEHPISAA